MLEAASATCLVDTCAEVEREGNSCPSMSAQSGIIDSFYRCLVCTTLSPAPISHRLTPPRRGSVPAGGASLVLTLTSLAAELSVGATDGLKPLLTHNMSDGKLLMALWLFLKLSSQLDGARIQHAKLHGDLTGARTETRQPAGALWP